MPHSSSTLVKTHAYDVTGYVIHLNLLMTVRAKCFLEVKRFLKTLPTASSTVTTLTMATGGVETSVFRYTIFPESVDVNFLFGNFVRYFLSFG